MRMRGNKAQYIFVRHVNAAPLRIQINSLETQCRHNFNCATEIPRNTISSRVPVLIRRLAEFIQVFLHAKLDAANVVGKVLIICHLQLWRQKRMEGWGTRQTKLLKQREFVAKGLRYFKYDNKTINDVLNYNININSFLLAQFIPKS